MGDQEGVGSSYKSRAKRQSNSRHLEYMVVAASGDMVLLTKAEDVDTMLEP
jgi:hypothetical protein